MFLKEIIKTLNRNNRSKIITPIIIDNTILKIEFNLIKMDFSYQETVLLDSKFLFNNKAIVEVFNNTITIKSNSTNNLYKMCFILK